MSIFESASPGEVRVAAFESPSLRHSTFRVQLKDWGRARMGWVDGWFVGYPH
jgi:hypothetical protein